MPWHQFNNALSAASRRYWPRIHHLSKSFGQPFALVGFFFQSQSNSNGDPASADKDYRKSNAGSQTESFAYANADTGQLRFPAGTGAVALAQSR